MKIKNRIIMIFAILSIFVPNFSGCDNSTLSEYANRPNKLEITVFNGGYGNEWLKDVAKYYMDNIDLDTYVHVKTTVLNVEESTKVKAGLGSSDIYFLEEKFRKTDPIVELTDILDEYAIGENEYTIREKMGENLASHYLEDDKLYMLPYTDNHTYHFAYNQTTLNETLGSDNWRLPRTTEEFFDLGNRLAEKGVYLTAGAYGDHNEYFQYAIPLWFAHLTGYEAYDNFLNGKYKDGDNSWKFAESSPINISQNRIAIESMYNNVKTLSSANNGYMHVNSNAMTFMDLEACFYGYGFGLNSKKAAFICNGPWLENELGFLVDALGEPDMLQEIGIMKMPISSQIVLRLTSLIGTSFDKEQKLREIISYIDGEISEKPTNVLDEDIAIVEEARRMVASLTIGSVVIPSNSDNISLAKKFLRFLPSDVARKITAKATNGINMLSFDGRGLVNLDEEVSDFIVQLNNVMENAIHIDNNLYLFPFAYNTGFRLLRNSQLDYEIFATNPSSIKSAEVFYNEYYNYYNSRWAEMVLTH